MYIYLCIWLFSHIIMLRVSFFLPPLSVSSVFAGNVVCARSTMRTVLVVIFFLGGGGETNTDKNN